MHLFSGTPKNASDPELSLVYQVPECCPRLLLDVDTPLCVGNVHKHL